MSDDGKDAGLVAMITSILGGNKRAETVTPPPLTEAPPTAPANEPEPVEPPALDALPAEPEIKLETTPEPAPETALAETNTAEAPPKVATTRDGKQLLPAEAIADLVLGELRKMENFPATGASVTVYGYRHWNAMITFAPFSTTFQNATRFRQALPDLVFKLRRFVELEI
ncbi:hypothetical protein [Bradyrhizobium sp. DOA1]|uniref:hypothetical protein n=1 Tax=Bradyrhizobium sp. DOA1 TaxID=1126616 RepID=UPI00077C48A2|nr:hypothetical protein [Bradyrhizobium sp. DOA1]KYG97946.1 hypothetical protein SE91_04815 [Bradyrhizobium sp. DOA1]